MKDERWMVVKDFPNYEISDYGRLRKWTNPRFLYKPLINTKDRVMYALYNGNGKQHRVQAHVLVLEHFVEPRPEGMEARHLDGNHRNNHWTNLVWGTHAENMRDKVAHGTHRLGGRPRTVTDEEARAIREEYQFRVKGKGAWTLAQKYGTTSGTVWSIVNGKTYVDA